VRNKKGLMMLTYYKVNDSVIIDAPISEFDGFIGEITELNKFNCKVKLRGNDNFIITLPYDVLDRINASTEPEGLEVTGKRKQQLKFVKEQQKWNDTWCSYKTGKATKEALENGTWFKENFQWHYPKVMLFILMALASLYAGVCYNIGFLPVGFALTGLAIWFSRPKGVYEYVSKHDV
jgi:hypothetical protein